MKWALIILFFGVGQTNAPTTFDTQLRFHELDDCLKGGFETGESVTQDVEALKQQRGSFYKAYRLHNWSCIPVKK
ncbi:MAG: hypothetical protein GKS01_13965 [Alphaproteobacteria bacterium]|nr:hypothetical protein [Alphaproteobacteria bacterium]